MTETDPTDVHISKTSTDMSVSLGGKGHPGILTTAVPNLCHLRRREGGENFVQKKGEILATDVMRDSGFVRE